MMSNQRREIEELRRQLAEADSQIVALLRQRARLTQRASELRAGSTPSPWRMRDELEAIEALASEELPSSAIRAIFQQIDSATRAHDARLCVAFVGPEGGFGQVAAQQQFGARASYVACADCAHALDEVQRQRADVAVLPFESSSEGPLAPAIVALAESELSLGAKVETSAQLHLMSNSGRVADVARVYAFAADAASCAAQLAALGHTSTVAAPSPRAAAERAREDGDGAALVPDVTGAASGLVTARANVCEAPRTVVRYAFASLRPAFRTGSDTTAVLVVPQPTGGLFELLKPFAERDIEVTCVQSCPGWDEGFAYRFFIEVSGHVTDRALITALELVKRGSRSLRVLGSFPTLRGGKTPPA